MARLQLHRNQNDGQPSFTSDDASDVQPWAADEPLRIVEQVGDDGRKRLGLNSHLHGGGSGLPLIASEGGAHKLPYGQATARMTLAARSHTCYASIHYDPPGAGVKC